MWMAAASLWSPAAEGRDGKSGRGWVAWKKAVARMTPAASPASQAARTGRLAGGIRKVGTFFIRYRTGSGATDDSYLFSLRHISDGRFGWLGKGKGRTFSKASEQIKIKIKGTFVAYLRLCRMSPLIIFKSMPTKTLQKLPPSSSLCLPTLPSKPPSHNFLNDHLHHQPWQQWKTGGG